MQRCSEIMIGFYGTVLRSVVTITKRGMKGKKGFTLVELIIAITIVGILAIVIVPSLLGYIEQSHETIDIVNVRSAYLEVRTASMVDNTSSVSKTVRLEQKRDDWQSVDPVAIAGIKHYKREGDTDHWKGVPTANGECEITYTPSAGIVFYWKGKNETSTVTGVDFNENLHSALNNTSILSDLNANKSTRFEIDSQCPNSTMVPKVQEQIGKNSLLNYGTWAYLGSPQDASGRYLFWTSVDANAVGAGKKVPVIVSRADGGFYISETTTAIRSNKGKEYVAVADHIYNSAGFRPYTKGERYDSLTEAYAAYEKLVAEKYPDYKDTLPK